MTCLIKKSFQNHYALQHLSFLPAQHLCICSIRRLFLDHFWAFRGFWAWCAGISRMWNEASSIGCYVVEHWNTMLLSQALDLILWMSRQGSFLTRLSDKTLLWKQLSGGGERNPYLGKTLRITFWGCLCSGYLKLHTTFISVESFSALRHLSELVKWKFTWSDWLKMDAVL